MSVSSSVLIVTPNRVCLNLSLLPFIQVVEQGEISLGHSADVVCFSPGEDAEPFSMTGEESIAGNEEAEAIFDVLMEALRDGFSPILMSSVIAAARERVTRAKGGSE